MASNAKISFTRYHMYDQPNLHYGENISRHDSRNFKEMRQDCGGLQCNSFDVNDLPAPNDDLWSSDASSDGWQLDEVAVPSVGLTLCISLGDISFC